MLLGALVSSLLKLLTRNRPPAPTPVRSQTIQDCMFSGMSRWEAGLDNYDVDKVEDYSVMVGLLGWSRAYNYYATCQWCPLSRQSVDGKNAPHP